MGKHISVRQTPFAALLLLLTALNGIGDEKPVKSAKPPAEKEAASTEIAVWCGRITGVRTVSKPVLWRDLDKVLLAGRFRPSETDDESTLMRRPPVPGHQYVVIDFKLANGRSVGKYDWKLAFADEALPCLAMSRDLLPFDARNWEYRYSNGLAVIHLLFEVPKKLSTATLVPALPLTLPEPAIRLNLVGGIKTSIAGVQKTEVKPGAHTVAKGKSGGAPAPPASESSKKPTPPKPKPTPGEKRVIKPPPAPAAPATKPKVVKKKPIPPAKPKPAPAKPKPTPAKPKPAVDSDWE